MRLKRLGCEAACDDAGFGGNQPAHRLCDVPAPAVIRGDGQSKPLVVRCALLAFGDQLPDPRLEMRSVADDAKTDAVLVELGDFLLQRAEKELHENRNL